MDTRDAIEAMKLFGKAMVEPMDLARAFERICDTVIVALEHLDLPMNTVAIMTPNKKKDELVVAALSFSSDAKVAMPQHVIDAMRTPIPLGSLGTVYTQALNGTTEVAVDLWQEPLVGRTIVVPFSYHEKPRGIILFSSPSGSAFISQEERAVLEGLTEIAGLAVRNAQLVASLEETTQNLKDTNERLSQADKLKDEFVTVASHELRTPMTAIKGSLATILDGFAGSVSAEAREFLTAAYTENERLIRLVNNLLSISRLESGTFTFMPTRIQMDEIIAECVKNLELAAHEKNLTLVFEKGLPVPPAYADEDKVREILINIIGNAIKFTHKGGVTVRVRLDNSRVVTSVTDTGSGIAAEDKEVLFKKFSQVRGNYARETGGTGLGLYICKKIVEGMNGTIWFDSALGEGSTFSFSLPLA